MFWRGLHPPRTSDSELGTTAESKSWPALGERDSTRSESVTRTEGSGTAGVVATVGSDEVY